MFSEPRLLLNRTNLIGVLDSISGLSLPRGPEDALELRLDHFTSLPSIKSLRKLELPLIITLRHLQEGGKKYFSPEQRVQWIQSLLQDADREGEGDIIEAVDVELAFLHEVLPIRDTLQALGKRLILSYHHFHHTPDWQTIQALFKQAREEGGDIFKLAITPQQPSDFIPLLKLFEEAKVLDNFPISAMGMGAFGKISRLLCAQLGSVLNYGWIEQPAVRGQWSVLELDQRFQELGLRAPRL